MPSFARELEQTLHNALAEASDRRHEYATLEHLLLALIDDARCRRGDEGLRRRPGRACRRRCATISTRNYESLKIEDETDPSPTSGFQRVVQRAILHVQSSGKRRGDRRQRAGRAVLRTRELCRLFPPAAGHEPARRGHLHQPRRRQGRAPARKPRDRKGAEETEAGRGQAEEGQEGSRARPVHASTSTRRRRTARSIR